MDGVLYSDNVTDEVVMEYIRNQDVIAHQNDSLLNICFVFWCF